jgi:hypothetical protein
MNTNLIVSKNLHANNEISVERCEMEGKMNILEGIQS